MAQSTNEEPFPVTTPLRTSSCNFVASSRLLVDSGIAAAPLVIAGVTALFGIASAMFTISGLGILGALMANRYLPRRAKPSEQIMPTSENM